MALGPLFDRERVTWSQQFRESPCPTLARSLYAWRRRLLGNAPPTGRPSRITVVCISDTHNKQPDLPPGDVLIHAGDLTDTGTIEELQKQLDWLDAQPHQHKIVIAGNHDLGLDEAKSDEVGISSEARRSLRWGSIKYLERSNETLGIVGGRKLKIHGNPWTRKQGNWAFQYEKGADMFTNQASDDVDIMVTHSPPQFHLDVAGWGEDFLLRELWRTRPRLHIFGHMHDGYGQDVLVYDQFERLYEKICAGNGTIATRLSALVRMGLLLSWQWATDSCLNSPRTVLINASVTGGLRDEKTRQAHVISL